MAEKSGDQQPGQKNKHMDGGRYSTRCSVALTHMMAHTCLPPQAYD